jgi:hypothetical protein
METSSPGQFARTVRLAWLALAASLVAGACGSASTNIVAPTAQKCQISVTNFTGTFGAAGGSGTATVNAARECSWSAATQAAWISLPSPAEGTGEGTLSFTVAANQAARARSAALEINNQQLMVSQEPAPCRFSVSPTGAQLGASGGSGSIAVAAADGCGWTAAAQAPWLRLASSGGSGNGTVGFTVAANAGPERRGDLIVAGQTVTVVQAAAPAPGPPPTPGCQFTVSPSALSFSAAGGQSALGLNTASGCAWQATASASWIALTPAQGTRSGTVTVTAEPNTAASAREGTIAIAGRVVQVTQDGAVPAIPIHLSGRVSNRRGSCPSLTFVVDGATVVTNANTDFVNEACDKIKNDTRVTVDGLQQAGQPVAATRVTITGN